MTRLPTAPHDHAEGGAAHGATNGAAGTASTRSAGRLQGAPFSPPPVASVGEALEALARTGRPWITIHGGKNKMALSAEEGYHLARCWAAALVEAGARPGDRVAVIAPNDASFVGPFFGAMLAGVTPVPLPWPMLESVAERRHATLAAQLEAAAPVAVCTPASFASAFPFQLPVVTAPSVTAQAGYVQVEPEHPAFLQFTSGTTSAPRGAVISHRAALASAWAMGGALGVGEKDHAVSWLPLFHDMGLVGVLVNSLLWRFQVHLMMPATFLMHPRKWLDLITTLGASFTCAPNFGYDLVNRRVSPEGLALGTLEAALDGSEPVHRGTIDAFNDRFAPAGFNPRALRPVYGLAENTLGVSFSAHADTPVENDLRWQGRSVPTVGRPLAGMEVEIRLPDDSLAAPGAEGEICVRSPSLMSGYFRHPEATAAALRGGWLRTGDLGVVQGGLLYVTGREKDLVIRNGRKFHPYDLERVVAQAVETTPNGVAAFSVPHPVSGVEELVLMVELRRKGESEQAEAQRLIRGKLVEQAGIRPDFIQLMGPGALPRTTSGKVQRRACLPLFDRERASAAEGGVGVAGGVGVGGVDR